MITDQRLIEVIDRSPLSEEDKKHWKQILPKLTTEQRERLHHSITSKTEIRRAMSLISRALKIIDEAEQEAEQEVEEEQKEKTEKENLLKELEEIKNTEEEILLDEKSLRKNQQQTQSQINQLRDQLKQLSIEAHGQPPPSYQNDNQSIPQIQRK